MSGIFKWYYLAQFSFWVQQILVIHMEARRKDHAQMLIHHVITCTLIFITYVYRYYRVANVVLCLMDVVDFIFPVSNTNHLHICLCLSYRPFYGSMRHQILIRVVPQYRSRRSSAILGTKWPATSPSVCSCSLGS